MTTKHCNTSVGSVLSAQEYYLYVSYRALFFKLVPLSKSLVPEKDQEQDDERYLIIEVLNKKKYYNKTLQLIITWSRIFLAIKTCNFLKQKCLHKTY